jgi:hypothetical protein
MKYPNSDQTKLAFAESRQYGRCYLIPKKDAVLGAIDVKLKLEGVILLIVSV